MITQCARRVEAGGRPTTVPKEPLIPTTPDSPAHQLHAAAEGAR